MILISRLLTFPRTPWELDEFLFLQAIRKFEPLQHHPHPPGYPLYVALGKLANAIAGDPFAGLVALSIVACVIGYVALYDAFRRWVDDANVAAAGSLVFYLSAGMLIHSSLALADATAIMFLSLALSAFARESPLAAGIFASAAIGCRPQFAVPLVPAFGLALLWMRGWRARLAALAAFTIVSLLWIVPLIQATGGWNGFLHYEVDQAKYVAAHDAGLSRGSKTLLRVAVRFALRPWGSTATIGAIVALCAIGFLRVPRTRRVIPLVAFAVIHLGFAILGMDPADAVRYALPAMPLFALLAAIGLGALRIPWIGAGAIAALSAWYVSPILIDRVSKPSPVVAAARFVRATFPRDTIVLYQAGTRPHADWLLPEYRRAFVETTNLADAPATPALLFADGGSVAKDARVFGWRASNAYVKMTRNFGRRFTVDPVRAEERFVPVRGVFALERTADDEEWRWLAPVAVLRLPRLGKSEVSLTFDLSPDAPYDRDDLEILVDGRAVARAVATKTPSSAVVPSGAVVEIRSARSFRPDDVLHNRDTRLLAVQLVAVEQR